MHLRRPPLRLLIVLIGGLLSLQIIGASSGQADICPALVEQALAEVGSNCDGLGRNSACYGFNRVDATFFESQPDDYFDTPTDVAELVDLETIRTAPLDVDRSEWGIAVMKVQADLPQSLPGAAVTMLLLGDVALENAADPAQSYVPAEPVELRTRDFTNLRSRPSPRANVIGGLAPDTAISADGISTDGRWLRVVAEGQVGWLYRPAATDDAALNLLPTLSEDTVGSMQAFTLQTGITGVSCQEAPPSLLVVQSPEHVQVQLTVNGVDVILGSTVAFSANPVEGMDISVLDGYAQFENGLVVPTGFTVNVPLDANGQSSGLPGGSQPFSTQLTQTLQTLNNIPGSLLSYSIDAPTQADIEAIVDALTPPTAAPVSLPPVPTVPGAPAVPAGSALPAAPSGGSNPVVPEPTPLPTLPPEVTDEPGRVTGQPLTLFAPCAAFTGDPRTYTLTNPNDVAVPFSWSRDSGDSGNGAVPPRSTWEITLPDAGENVMTVDYGYGTVSYDPEPC